MKFITTLLAFLLSINFAISQDLLKHKGNDIFFSGINLAWVSFAYDLDEFDEEVFDSALTEISEAGGNALRWWLHVNGEASPTFTNDSVSGIDEVELVNLKRGLDLAARRGIALDLCLWSFDMMAYELDDSYRARNELLLTDTVYTNAYINNALIPMVEYVKGHTAIMCWEIFNEPEGMSQFENWSHVKNVDYYKILRTVNLCAAAIHKTDTSAKVSVGAVNGKMFLGKRYNNNYYNYYSDSSLIAEGGDSAGVLDFYMMHYYPDYYDETTSPFHQTASYWDLDKPIVVGEFPAHGIIPSTEDGVPFAPATQLTPDEAYNWAFDNGYAGVFAWTWTNHDGNGGLPDIADALADLKSNHTDSIVIPTDPDYNYIPMTVGELEDTAVFMNSDTVHLYANLNDYFFDETKMTYSIEDSGAVKAIIEQDSMLSITTFTDSAGIGIITVYATDEGGEKTSQEMGLFVVDTSTTNHFLTRQALVSSEETDDYLNFYVTDGNEDTRWSSTYYDNQWILIDLWETETISRIYMDWEDAYGDQYEILTSLDKVTWESVYTETYGNGGGDNIVFDPVQARYVKFALGVRPTEWGFSLWEVEAYTDNGESENSAPTCRNRPTEKKLYTETDINYEFPTFITDPDDDKLTYTLTMSDGSAIPDWMNFDSDSLKITGMASVADTGTYVTILTGTDIFDQSVEYQITFIVVSTSTSIDEIQQESLFTYSLSEKTLEIVSNTNDDYSIIISDITGRNLISKSNVTNIDLTGYNSGVFLINFRTDTASETQKFILR